MLPQELRVYAKPAPSRQYVIGVDCAEGVKGGDDSTAVVLDKLTGMCVAVLAGEYEPTEHHPALITLPGRWYNSAPVLIERNNHGHAVIGSCKRHGVVCCNGVDGRADGKQRRSASLRRTGRLTLTSLRRSGTAQSYSLTAG